MTETTISLPEFLTRYDVRMAARRVDSNPQRDCDTRNQMDHWRCSFAVGRRRMSLVFSMGSGHHGREPKAGEVLDCLAMDAAGVRNARDFADWCAEYGYDTDSRKAEKSYRVCRRQAESLERLLGAEAFEILLYKTERE